MDERSGSIALFVFHKIRHREHPISYRDYNTAAGSGTIKRRRRNDRNNHFPADNETRAWNVGTIQRSGRSKRRSESNQIPAADYNEEIPDPLTKRRTAKRRVTGRYNGTVRSGYDEPFTVRPGVLHTVKHFGVIEAGRRRNIVAGQRKHGQIGHFIKSVYFGVGQQVFGPVFNVKAGQRWRTKTL